MAQSEFGLLCDQLLCRVREADGVSGQTRGRMAIALQQKERDCGQVASISTSDPYARASYPGYPRGKVARRGDGEGAPTHTPMIRLENDKKWKAWL